MIWKGRRILDAGYSMLDSVGAWLGGRVYDATGSYDTVWIASIALGVIAAALHWPIADAPVARLRAAEG